MIDYAPELHELGFSDARLRRLGTRIERDLDANRYHGIALRVSRHGRPVVTAHLGTTGSPESPITADSVFNMLSLTKVVTAVVTLRMVEDGWFALTTPLSTVIPELTGTRASISVYHVLTQTSGLPIDTPGVAAEVVADLEQYARVAFEAEPICAPGERAAYSARIAHTVLGLFLQRVAGKPFPELVREFVSEPLGMRDTVIGRAPEQDARRVPLSAAPYVTGEQRDVVDGHIDYIDQFSLREGAVVPGSNGFSTPDDVHRLALALLTGRDAAGELYLSGSMRELVSRNHTGQLVNDLVVMTLRGRNLVEYPAYLAMGFWGRGDGMIHGAFGHLTSPRTFGGLGRGTNVLWVDPLHGVAFSALTAGLMDEADNLHRFSVLSDLVMSSLMDA